MSNFRTMLGKGAVGESLIARWLIARGNSVLPAYEKIMNDYKGPRLQTPGGSLIAPDLLVFNLEHGTILWVEAKHKTAFSWYRASGQWTTGIDLRHYEDYCHVDDVTPWPVWLFFLHQGGYAKDNPEAESPSGLYGNLLSHLRQHEHHRSEEFNNGRGGVFWEISALRYLASIEQVQASLDVAA